MNAAWQGKYFAHRAARGLPPGNLVPVLVRLPPEVMAELRDLVHRTRVRQSDYLREAVADLVRKYRPTTPPPEAT